MAAAGVLAIAAATVGVLALAGALSGDGEDGDQDVVRTARPAESSGEANAAPEPPAGSKPELTTVRVGGRPTAIVAGHDGVWTADSFSPRATVLESEAADATPTDFRLEGPASDVAANVSGAWYALPDQQAIERRGPDDPAAGGDTVDLEGFPIGVAATRGAVYALSERSVESIDAEAGEVEERFDVDGFPSSIAVDEGGVWVVTDNKEVERIDPESGESEADPVRIREAFGVATGEGAAWVVSASGEVTRIDPGSLEATVAPQRVRGALDVAAGHGSVWITSSKRTVTRLDPESLEPVGEPLRVGDEPGSVAVGSDAVWVANGGEGTLTRIEP